MDRPVRRRGHARAGHRAPARGARAAAADARFTRALAKVETPVQYLDAPQMRDFWEADARTPAAAVQRVGKVE